VPENYVNEVKTGGDIEAKYLAIGSYAVKNIKVEASENTKYFYVYYPEELENTEKKEEMDTAIRTAIETLDDEEQQAYIETWEEIMSEI